MNVRVLALRNISHNQVTIGVGPPLELEEGTGTDVTSYVPLFDGEGVVVVHPGKIFVIEEDRVNLGQIENLVQLRQLQIRVTLRSVSDLTAEG